MKSTDKNIMTETNILKIVKYSLAIIIIVMGSYGYHRFFSSTNSDEPVWLIVFLFIIIETAILTMTTINFSTILKQTKSIGMGLVATISVMWLISGVGIDQTIWGMVESKYHTVKLNETAVIAEKETESLLNQRISDLRTKQREYKNEINVLEDSKFKAQKAYDKTARQLKDIIWYNGNRCDLSTDCTARKNVAENALDLAKQELDDYSLSIKTIKENIIINNKNIERAKNSIENIVKKRVEFEKYNRVTLENKKEEALIHVQLMNLLNSILGLQIETPERAYVMLLSFIVYPVYILFIAFMSSNSVEMKKIRERQQIDRLKESSNKKNVFSRTLTKYLRKLIGYLISTRVRKVIVKEVEIEVEVIKEVEKIVYKDGKEIVEIEIEVPHFIEKEIVIEKIIEKPIIEKEFITVPADINLNELNKLTGHGSTPKDLEEVLRKINQETKEQAPKWNQNDKYKAA